MSGEHLFDELHSTGWRRWLKRWWPSARLGRDPLDDLRIDGRYVPVSVANWKLIPSVTKALLSHRVARPLTFAPDQRLTVVIPYRDRAHHLEQLLPVLAATLDQQHIRHRILVVEQADAGPFNRGRLLNIGVAHAADDTDYYCLHDVDAVPVHANYACPSQPLRLVHKIRGEQGDSTRATHYFSGAVSIRKEQMFAANGYSNEYWGWGKEDDDFFFRLLLAGFLCFYDEQGEFHDLPNPRQQQVARKTAEVRRRIDLNRERRSRLQRGLEDPRTDGLSTLKYQVVSRSEGVGYEMIRVSW